VLKSTRALFHVVFSIIIFGCCLYFLPFAANKDLQYQGWKKPTFFDLLGVSGFKLF